MFFGERKLTNMAANVVKIHVKRRPSISDKSFLVRNMVKYLGISLENMDVLPKKTTMFETLIRTLFAAYANLQTWFFTFVFYCQTWLKLAMYFIGFVLVKHQEL